MTDQEKDISVSSEHEASGGHASREDRRRLLKGAAAVTPVILTVASRPALGAICTPSGFISGNLSHTHEEDYCYGRSPGYWKNRNPEPETRWTDVFCCLWRDNAGITWDTNYTFDQILKKLDGNDDHYEFAFHAVACYLNAKYKPDGIYAMTEQNVQDLINDVLTTGYYHNPVTGTMVWDAQGVVDFIAQTFGPG